MATIQVRNIPDDVHRRFRERAAAAGMSLQELLHAELCAAARRKTPAEVVADVERRLREEGAEGFSTISSVSFIRSDRDER
jgi:plasmid stability protein